MRTHSANTPKYLRKKFDCSPCKQKHQQSNCDQTKLNKTLNQLEIESGSKQLKTISGQEFTYIQPGQHIVTTIPPKTKNPNSTIIQQLQKSLILTHHIDLKSISLFLDFIKTNHPQIKETALQTFSESKITKLWAEFEIIRDHQTNENPPNWNTHKKNIPHILDNIQRTLKYHHNLDIKTMQKLREFILSKKKSLTKKQRQELNHNNLTPIDIKCYWEQFKQSEMESNIKKCSIIPNYLSSIKIEELQTSYPICSPKKTQPIISQFLDWIKKKDPELTKKLFPHSTLLHQEKKKLENLFINYKKYRLEVKIKEIIEKTDKISQIELKELKDSVHTEALNPQKSINNNLYMDQVKNTESILISNFTRYILKENNILFSTQDVLFNRLVVKEFSDYTEINNTEHIEQEYNLYVEIISKLWIKYKNEFTGETESESHHGPLDVINFEQEKNEKSTPLKTNYITILNPFNWFFSLYPKTQDTKIIENQQNCFRKTSSSKNSNLEQENIVNHQTNINENPPLTSINTTVNLFDWFISPYSTPKEAPKTNEEELLSNHLETKCHDDFQHNPNEKTEIKKIINKLNPFNWFSLSSEPPIKIEEKPKNKPTTILRPKKKHVTWDI